MASKKKGSAPTRKSSVPLGSKIERTYKGKTITISCNKDGTFEHDGKTYTSLSACASAICGCHVSGNAWFGVGKKAS